MDRGTDPMEISLQEIARMVDGEAIGDPGFTIRGAAPFEAAGPDQITFAAQPKFLKGLSGTAAGAVIVPAGFEPEDDASGKCLVRARFPQAAFARVAARFYPPHRPGYLGSGGTGTAVSPSAHIGNHFSAGDNTAVAPFAVIGDAVSIGRNGAVHPHAVIGDGVVMGDDVVIGPGVHIGHGCRIGNRVTIQAGTVIGADGFGWAPEGTSYRKIPHTGIVRIEDDVEIGACNTIDRGTFGETRICRGVRTDNLVHVAHNVTVGEDTLLVAQVGIAGSTAIGRHAVLAGQVGISGHLTIGDNVTIGPQAGIGKSIGEGEVVSGSPGIPHRLWLRVQRIIPLLPEIKKSLDAIEKRLKRIEDNG